MLTQLSRCGTVLKLQLDDVRVHVITRFHIEGSIFKGTLASEPLEFDSRIEIQSAEPEEQIRQLVTIAENSCYVMQSVAKQVKVNRSFELNGQALESVGQREGA